MNQLEDTPKNFEPKPLKEILVESVFDLLGILGLNKGVLRTLIDLIKQPAQVIAAYHNSDLTYTRPMSFCLIAGGAYLFVANYVINWDVSTSSIMEFYLWFFTIISPNPNPNPNPEKLKVFKEWIEFGVDIFLKKYFVVFIIAQGFLRAATFTKFKEGASYGNMLVIMLYRNGGSIFIYVGSLLCLLIPNIFGFISFLVVPMLADHYAFRNYINLTLGQGSKKSFQKRIFKVIAIVGILYILFAGIVMLYLFLNEK